MRSLFLSILPVILLSSGIVRGQSLHVHDSASNRLERMEYVLAASAAFSLADFIGFNYVNTHYDIWHGGPARPVYHSLLIGLGAAINYFLYKQFDLPTALSFDMLWWTWCLDLAFYGWGEVVNPAAPWTNRSFNGGIANETINWAGWTPIGLFHPQRSSIPRSDLIVQAVWGFAVSIELLW